MHINKDPEIRPTTNEQNERMRLANEQRIERLDFIRHAAIAIYTQLEDGPGGEEVAAELRAWQKAERLWSAKPDKC
jgi:hypothetical protein